MGKQKKNYTPEEYEENKKLILSFFRDGFPIRRINAKTGYTRPYIAKIRDDLIAEGLITEEEIKTASAKYYKENPSAQGLDKSKVRKPKGRKKFENRHNQSLEKRERVFELVKQGLTKTEIARMLEISETGVSWQIKKLIEER